MRVDGSRLREFVDDITNLIYSLNSQNRLEAFLEEHHFELETEDVSFDRKKAKILIIGQLLIDKTNLEKMLRYYKIDVERRVEIAGDYYDAVNYPWDKLRYNDKYSDVIVGSMPHSGNGKGDYNSIISRVTREEGFPNVILALDSNGELALNKSSIKKALEQTKFIKYCI